MSMPNDDNSQLASHFFGDLLESIIVDVASECHRVARLGLDRNLEEEEEELRLSAQARVKVADPSNSGEANSKYVVDIFGQTHPAVANELFECMNCGRSIGAGRFAPHLEKCMGKEVSCYHTDNPTKICAVEAINHWIQEIHGPQSNNYYIFAVIASWTVDLVNPMGRKARLKATRSSTAAQTRYSRGSPISTYSPYSNSTSVTRVANGTPGVAGEEYGEGTPEEP